MRDDGTAARGLDDLLTCLGFFSRLPLPNHAARPFGAAIRLVPLAGAIIGACGALTLVVADRAGLPHIMTALVYAGTLLMVTGALHEDGLADTVDGFGGGASRERKLAIMRDSRIGSYGVLALMVATGWRVAVVDTLLGRATAWEVASILVAVAATSRALALLPLAVLPPARADGLGRGVGPLRRDAVTTCLLLAAAIGLVLPVAGGVDLRHAVLACAVAAGAALTLCRLARHQIGGHTGDVAGATQQVAEAAFTLGLLAFPS